MGRSPRASEGGLVYHALNRGNARALLFEREGDYLAFEEVMAEAYEHTPVRILAYCIMPNHFHFVLWPQEDGQLSDFMHWFTVTHTQRWHAYHDTSGTGHLYQGRFKSFPVQTDEHFLTVVRYVERNALRAGLVQQAEDWRWSTPWRRLNGRGNLQQIILPPSEWPVEPPANWGSLVNEPDYPAELEAVRECVTRGRPFGSESWVLEISVRLGLTSTLRPRGRPRKSRRR